MKLSKKRIQDKYCLFNYTFNKQKVYYPFGKLEVSYQKTVKLFDDDKELLLFAKKNDINLKVSCDTVIRRVAQRYSERYWFSKKDTFVMEKKSMLQQLYKK